jgi:Uma2 family endonuclease
MATATSIMAAEEYMDLPDSFDRPIELVKGELVTMTPPLPRHGEICSQIIYLLRKYFDEHPAGRVLCNDSSMITERGPDTVRGPDVAYYSYDRLPKGPLPQGLLPVSPDMIFEVRSPNDRWGELHTKVAEYLNVNVKAVCVVDDETRTIHVFFADVPPQILTVDDDFALPEILGEFMVKVERFFE